MNNKQIAKERNIKEISRIFVETRELIGMSQREFAKTIGTTQTRISLIESEKQSCPGWVLLEVQRLNKKIQIGLIGRI